MRSFPNSLKCANVRPIYEKEVYFDEKNWQASNYFELFFNKILCGFRKAHSMQHASFKLLT